MREVLCTLRAHETTFWVNVKSHTAKPFNERLDDLAHEGGQESDEAKFLDGENRKNGFPTD